MTRRKLKWYTIYPYLLPCKAAYFFVVAKEVTLRMNMVLFLTSIGLSKSQAGLVVGIRLLSVMVGAPVFGIIGDKFKTHRLMISLCCFVAMLCTVLQPVLAYKFGPRKSFLYCNHNSLNSINTSDHDGNNTNTIFDNYNEILHNNMIKKLFWVMLGINMFQSFFDGALDGFLDAGVMMRLTKINKQLKQQYCSYEHKYGNQRLFGVFGKAIALASANYIVDAFPTERVTCYTGILVVYALLLALYWLSLMWLFHGLRFDDAGKKENTIKAENLNLESLKTAEESKEDFQATTDIEFKLITDQKAKDNAVTFRKKLFGTLLKEEMLMMFFINSMVGVCRSQYLGYSFLYMKDLNATAREMSVFIVVVCCGDLIGFFNSSRILHFCGGPFKSLLLAVFAYAIRFVGVASMDRPILVDAFQVFSMFDMPITETVSLEFVMRKSPKSVLTSMICLLNAFQYSLPDVLGLTLGGYIYDVYGGKSLFYSCAILAGIVSLMLLSWLLRRKFKKVRLFQEKE